MVGEQDEKRGQSKGGGHIGTKGTNLRNLKMTKKASNLRDMAGVPLI